MDYRADYADVGDDVIIVAEPLDTTDHNQDGYGVYGAELSSTTLPSSISLGTRGHTRAKCVVAESQGQK